MNARLSSWPQCPCVCLSAKGKILQPLLGLGSINRAAVNVHVLIYYVGRNFPFWANAQNPLLDLGSLWQMFPTHFIYLLLEGGPHPVMLRGTGGDAACKASVLTLYDLSAPLV